MKILVSYWRRGVGGLPDYDDRIIKVYSGNTAKECMAQVNAAREHHNVVNYTPMEIINVED